jgi:hypothetical protein
MRVRAITIFVITLALLWALYAFGVLSGMGSFLLFGTVPESTATVGPTIMLIVYGFLLLTVGYIFGFMHGSLHQSVRLHLHRLRQQQVEPPIKVPAQRKTKPRRQFTWRQLIGLQSTTIPLQINSLSNAFKTLEQHSKLLASQSIITTKRLAIWLQPRIRRYVKMTIQFLLKAIKLLVNKIETAWIWLRNPHL